MDKNKAIIIFAITAAFLMLLASLVFRFTKPQDEITGQAFSFDIDGLDGAAYLPAKVATPLVRQLLLEFENEPEPEEEPEPEIPEISMEDGLTDEVLDETQIERLPFSDSSPVSVFPDKPEDSDCEILAGIKSSVDGILLCIMLLMSTGIVALILKIVYPLFRGGR